MTSLRPQMVGVAGRVCRAAAMAVVAQLFLAETALPATPLSVALRGSIALGETAVDQHGASFTVAGLSGITHLGGTSYIAVMDNSNKLAHLNIALSPTGAIASATIAGGLSLADSRDFEAIAYTNIRRGSVWISDEGAPQLREYDLQSGNLLQTIAAPGVYGSRRSGLGWESLARRAGGRELWTANEETLTVDGPASSPTQGSLVRIARFVASGDTYSAAEQYAYQVDPWHAGDSASTTAERSGLVELVALPDGTLLALERSLAFSSIIPSFQSRLYQLDLSAATNVAALPTLVGGGYSPVTKQLLWSGAAAGGLGMNLEGLALGPRLANGHATLLGVVDDGGSADPLSTNTLVSFEITSPLALPATPGDANFDGVVNEADAAILAGTFGSTGGAAWEDADFDGDGGVSLADLAVMASHFSPPAAALADQETHAAREVRGAPTPEPRMLWLAAAAAAGGAALLAWRRKRRAGQ